MMPAVGVMDQIHILVVKWNGKKKQDNLNLLCIYIPLITKSAVFPEMERKT